MKQFILLFILAVTSTANLQAKIIKYHYWFNDDYSQRITVNVTQKDTLELDFEVDVSALPPGFHFLNMMFEDNSGKHTAPEASYFFIPYAIHNDVDYKIVGYEYWFNNEFVNRQYVQTTGSDTLNLNLQFDISHLNSGLNFLNMRYRSSDSLWSVPETNYFIIPFTFESNIDYKIVGYEYWFNSDFESRQYIQTAETDTLEITNEFDVSHLPPGMHLLNKRFRTSDSLWSIPETVYFIIPYVSDISPNYNIVAYEYWFNDDFTNRSYIEIISADTLNFLDSINVTNLPNGIHLFNYRVKTNLESWSIPITDYFNNTFKYQLVDSSNFVRGIKYWFDGDPDKYYIYYYDSLAYELNIEQEIDVSNLIGNRTIYIHALDSAGYQSLPFTFDFTNSFSFIVDKNIVTFDVPEITGYQYLWQFGDGTSSNLVKPTHTYKKGGTFNVRLILTRGTPSVKDTLIEQVTITLVTQDIPLAAGWNMISTYIQPDETDMEDIFADIVENTVIVKNNLGQIYFPMFEINDIGSWNLYHGYQVYMSQADTMSISGVQAIPQSSTMNLSAGWNMIAYLRDSPMDIQIALAPIVIDENLVIAKDNLGNVYFPAFEINMIGDMIPGQGYQIYLLSGATLIYPEN
jgi:hypothetical protein